MTAGHKIARLAALFAFSFVAVTSSRATTVRGGSNYGGDTGASCISEINSNDIMSNCETFTTAMFTIDGVTYNGDIFYYAIDQQNYGTLDILNTNSTSFTLNLVNPSLQTGIFMCGSDNQSSSVATPSTPPGATESGLYCMQGAADTGNFDQNQTVTGVTQTPTTTGFVFANSGSAGLVVYTVDGNIAGVTPAPEPSSLMLFGAGLMGLAVFARKAR